MLETKGLYLSYTKEYFTLHDINFAVGEKETVIIVGEKESGKSSLIRILAGLEAPTSGSVLINGKPLVEVSFRKDVSLGYLSAFGAFLKNRSVRKNLEYVLKIRKFNKNEIKNMVSTAILKNKLENISHMKIKNISEFDKLRVAIARLSLRPLDILLIDDVFEELSDKETTHIIELLHEVLLQNSQASVVVAVENLQMAQNFKGRVVKLEYGSIV